MNDLTTVLFNLWQKYVKISEIFHMYMWEKSKTES